MPCRIASMMASGSSPLGLSDVRTTRSASRDATSPIGARLDGSRSPPLPNTTDDTAARGQITGGPEHLLEPVGRVGVVDDDGERLSGVDRLEPSRHGSGAAMPAAIASRIDAEHARGHGGGQRVGQVEHAAERHVQLDAVPAAARRPDVDFDVGDVASEYGSHGTCTRSTSMRPHSSSTLITACAQRSRVNSDAFASKYSSIVRWKSRWSRLRFVNTADAEPCAVHAMLRERVRRDLHRDRSQRPRRASMPSSCCSSVASGVVRAPVSVPMTAAGRPAASSTDRSRCVVVVLPFVPVTPTTSRSRDGWPWKAAAAGPIARACRRHDGLHHRCRAASRSHSSATAPASTARSAKSCPSTTAPGTQQNSEPCRDGAGVVHDPGHLDAHRHRPRCVAPRRRAGPRAAARQPPEGAVVRRGRCRRRGGPGATGHVVGLVSDWRRCGSARARSTAT